MTVGDRYERLVVLRIFGQDAVVRCDCGSTTTKQRRDILAGRTLSCGCLRRQLSAQRLRDIAKGNVTFSDDVIKAVRSAPPTVTSVELAKVHGMTAQYAAMLRRGLWRKDIRP